MQASHQGTQAAATQQGGDEQLTCVLGAKAASRCGQTKQEMHAAAAKQGRGRQHTCAPWPRRSSLQTHAVALSADSLPALTAARPAPQLSQRSPASVKAGQLAHDAHAPRSHLLQSPLPLRSTKCMTLLSLQLIMHAVQKQLPASCIPGGSVTGTAARCRSCSSTRSISNVSVINATAEVLTAWTMCDSQRQARPLCSKQAA